MKKKMFQSFMLCKSKAGNSPMLFPEGPSRLSWDSDRFRHTVRHSKKKRRNLRSFSEKQ